MSKKQKLYSLALTAGCVCGGYVFYKINPHDPIPAVIFAVGLLGIMLSFVRNQKKK